MVYNKDVLMKCRCSNSGARRQTEQGEIPVCIHHNCTEVMDPQPEIYDRKARCMHCQKQMMSIIGLPFFVYRPDDMYDVYYCGCKGWE